MLDLNKQIKNFIIITPFNILNALKNNKCGKSHSRINVLLSLLFSAFVMHGYLPSMSMKTAIVPIIKNKTGDRRVSRNS